MPGSESTDGSDELIARAVAFVDQESHERWDVVAELHRRNDRKTFDAACRLAESEELRERVLGIDILGQIGQTANRPFRDQTLPILLRACEDQRPPVVSAAIGALGHLADTRALQAVIHHHAHPSDNVRFAVAVALPTVSGKPPAAEAIATLIELMDDAAGHVRDWATFGLGSQLDIDSEEIRAALAARLDDQDRDAAAEALLGLARRRDPRALNPLLSSLEEQDPGPLIVEAAAELSRPQALPALQRLKDRGWAFGANTSLLDDAIRACQRDGASADGNRNGPA